MPRRQTPDPLALRIGQRVRHLRQQAGLSLEKLAYESELGSKGHLSDLERGLIRPTITTLQAIADRLGVALLDLVSFPEEGGRGKLVEALRSASPREIEEFLAHHVGGGEGLMVGEGAQEGGDAYLRAFGRSLRSLRTSRGLEIEAVATRAGIEVDRYRAIEAGAWDPSLRLLRRIAEALGAEPRNLLPG